MRIKPILRKGEQVWYAVKRDGSDYISPTYCGLYKSHVAARIKGIGLHKDFKVVKIIVRLA